MQQAGRRWAAAGLMATFLVGAATVLTVDPFPAPVFWALLVGAAGALAWGFWPDATRRIREKKEKARAEELAAIKLAEERLESQERLRAWNERRERVAPMLAAFDEFLPPASRVRVLYRELVHSSEAITLSKWREFKRTIRRAIELASNLPAEQRKQMLRFLEPFRKAKKDRLDDLDYPDFQLGDILLKYSAYKYEPLRRELHLPAPKYRSSRPPSSPASS